MPRTKQPVSTEDRFAQSVNDDVDAQAKAIAESLGPAPGSDRYSSREVSDLWDTPDASLNQQALYQALQQGMSSDDVQKVALFRMAPELAQRVIGQQVDPATAAAIAKLAEYPGRYVLTTGHSTDAEEQVKFVADMHKQAAKRGAAMDTGMSDPSVSFAPAFDPSLSAPVGGVQTPAGAPSPAMPMQPMGG